MAVTAGPMGTWCQASELLHLLIFSSQAVLRHDSALLHNDDEDCVAAAAHLIQLGGPGRSLGCPPLHQAIHLRSKSSNTQGGRKLGHACVQVTSTVGHAPGPRRGQNPCKLEEG